MHHCVTTVAMVSVTYIALENILLTQSVQFERMS